MGDTSEDIVARAARKLEQMIIQSGRDAGIDITDPDLAIYESQRDEYKKWMAAVLEELGHADLYEALRTLVQEHDLVLSCPPGDLDSESMASARAALSKAQSPTEG